MIGSSSIPTAVEVVTQGKSLGRLAVGARIVRDDGGAIHFRHAFIRSLARRARDLRHLGGLAVLVALLNSKSKRLGDMLAGTYSQQERIEAARRPVFGVPYELSRWSKTADVARMPDPLARRVSQFLGQAGEHAARVARRASRRDLANEVSVYVSPLPAGSTPSCSSPPCRRIRRERELAALQRERAGWRARPGPDGQPHGFPDRG